MPKQFVQCVRTGGRVRTIKPKQSVYMHICYPKHGGAAIRGEIKHARTKLKAVPKLTAKRFI